MRCTTKRGFTLLEMVALVFLVSIVLSFTARPVSPDDKEHYRFMNDYLFTQSETMRQRKETLFENTYFYRGSGPIRFYANGNVNMAQTLHFKGVDVIIHLGNGYLSYA